MKLNAFRLIVRRVVAGRCGVLSLCAAVIWFGMVFSSALPANVPESSAENDRFINALDAANTVLAGMSSQAVRGGEICTTNTIRLTELIGEMKSSIPSLDSKADNAIAKIEESLGKLEKICQILTSVCMSGDFQNEAPVLVQQLTVHCSDIYRVYAEEVAKQDSTQSTGSKARLTASYIQWKAEMRSLLDQVKTHAAEKNWASLARLGETVSSLASLPLPGYMWNNVTGTDRQMLIYNRERLAVYGVILKEYAEEENLPHVLYFHEKIENLLASLP